MGADDRIDWGLFLNAVQKLKLSDFLARRAYDAAVKAEKDMEGWSNEKIQAALIDKGVSIYTMATTCDPGTSVEFKVLKEAAWALPGCLDRVRSIAAEIRAGSAAVRQAEIDAIRDDLTRAIQ